MTDNHANQVVIMTKADIDTLVKEITIEILTNQTVQSTAATQAQVKFYTRKEVAELLHVDLSTLWRWNRDGRLRACHTGGRGVLYSAEDVNNFILDH